MQTISRCLPGYFLPKNKLELKCFCCWQRSAAFEFSTIYAWFQSKLMIKLERGHQGPKCISRWQSSTSKNASLIFVFFNCNNAINISKTKGVHCQSILLGRASTFVYFSYLSYMKRIWVFLWKWANNFCYANNSFGLALPMNMQMKVNLVIRFREEMCCYVGHWWIWFTTRKPYLRGGKRNQQVIF